MILQFPDRPAQDIEAIRAALQACNEKICFALRNSDRRMVMRLRRAREAVEAELERALERVRVIQRASS